jgi:hypothetical protein
MLPQQISCLQKHMNSTQERAPSFPFRPNVTPTDLVFAETHEQNTGKSTLIPLLEATDSPVPSIFLATTLGKRNTGIRQKISVYPHAGCNISVQLCLAAPAAALTTGMNLHSVR